MKTIIAAGSDRKIKEMEDNSVSIPVQLQLLRSLAHTLPSSKLNHTKSNKLVWC